MTRRTSTTFPRPSPSSHPAPASLRTSKPTTSSNTSHSQTTTRARLNATKPPPTHAFTTSTPTKGSSPAYVRHWLAGWFAHHNIDDKISNYIAAIEGAPWTGMSIHTLSEHELFTQLVLKGVREEFADALTKCIGRARGAAKSVTSAEEYIEMIKYICCIHIVFLHLLLLAVLFGKEILFPGGNSNFFLTICIFFSFCYPVFLVVLWAHDVDVVVRAKPVNGI